MKEVEILFQYSLEELKTCFKVSFDSEQRYFYKGEYINCTREVLAYLDLVGIDVSVYKQLGYWRYDIHLKGASETPVHYDMFVENRELATDLAINKALELRNDQIKDSNFVVSYYNGLVTAICHKKKLGFIAGKNESDLGCPFYCLPYKNQLVFIKTEKVLIDEIENIKIQCSIHVEGQGFELMNTFSYPPLFFPC